MCIDIFHFQNALLKTNNRNKCWSDNPNVILVLNNLAELRNEIVFITVLFFLTNTRFDPVTEDSMRVRRYILWWNDMIQNSNNELMISKHMRFNSVQQNLVILQIARLYVNTFV